MNDSKVKLLAGIPLFAGCSKKELEHLVSLCTEMSFSEGTVLTRQGTSGREFVVLVSGTAEVVRDGVLLEHLTAGAPIGELALLDGSPRAATVTTSSAVEALVLSIAEFDAAIDTSPGLAKSLLRSMAKRLRTTLDLAHL